MKYYAVADDPNELLHYGRLGMKWGQHIFVGTKSLSYKKAEGKLRSKIQNAKATIQKSRTQHAVNRQKRQQEKFAKAVQKTQQRIALTEGFRDLDRLKAYERSDNRAFKQAYKAAKIADKNARAEARNELHYANNERKMNKYIQQARQGKLKYGKLSSDQVNQITNRLAIESNARRLGGAEETFRHRLKAATREGILQGVTQGVAAGMKEVAIDKVQNRLRNKRAMDKASRNEAHRQKEAIRIKNKKTRKEIREDLNQEAYEAQIESGAGVLERSRVLHPFTNLNAGKVLQTAEHRKRLNSQIAESKLLYDKNGNLTKRGKQLQAIEDRKMKLDAEKSIKKRLYEAEAYNEDGDGLFNTTPGQRLRALEDKQHERKRQQDMQDKFRNEQDEEWNKHVKEGGTTHLYDGKTNAIINLNDAKSESVDVRVERERVLAAKKQQEEAQERSAYEKRVKEEKCALKQAAFEKEKEDKEKQYDRAVKKWQDDDKADKDALAEYNKKVKEERAKNSWNPNYTPTVKPPTLRNTKKPDHADYEVNYKSFKFDAPKIESYDERKTLVALGVPTYFPYEKKNNNGGKKGNNGKK